MGCISMPGACLCSSAGDAEGGCATARILSRRTDWGVVCLRRATPAPRPPMAPRLATATPPPGCLRLCARNPEP